MDTTITESSVYSSCTVILVGKCLCLYLWIKIIHVTFPYETQTLQLLCQNFAHTDNPTSYVGYGCYDWDQQYTWLYWHENWSALLSQLYTGAGQETCSRCVFQGGQRCVGHCHAFRKVFCYFVIYSSLDWLSFYANNTIVYFSGCLWCICRT